MPWIEPIEGQTAKAQKKDHLRWPTLAEQNKILGTKFVRMNSARHSQQPN
jgi:hypothetical protein